MENDKGELVDLYVYPVHHLLPPPDPSFPISPTSIPIITTPANQIPPNQLRPPQMLRDQPHHKSQRPRLGANLRRQGRRERPLHGGEPSLRAVRVREGHGRGRRQFESVGAAGRAGEECVEWKFAAVGGCFRKGEMCVCVSMCVREWRGGGKGFVG